MLTLLLVGSNRLLFHQRSHAQPAPYLQTIRQLAGVGNRRGSGFTSKTEVEKASAEVFESMMAERLLEVRSTP